MPGAPPLNPPLFTKNDVTVSAIVLLFQILECHPVGCPSILLKLLFYASILRMCIFSTIDK